MSKIGGKFPHVNKFKSTYRLSRRQMWVDWTISLEIDLDPLRRRLEYSSEIDLGPLQRKLDEFLGD